MARSTLSRRARSWIRVIHVPEQPKFGSRRTSRTSKSNPITCLHYLMVHVCLPLSVIFPDFIDCAVDFGTTTLSDLDPAKHHSNHEQTDRAKVADLYSITDSRSPQIIKQSPGWASQPAITHWNHRCQRESSQRQHQRTPTGDPEQIGMKRLPG